MRREPVLTRGWFVAAICLLVTVAHLPLRHSGYVFDDHAHIENNPIVQGGGPAEIFSTGYAAGAGTSERQLYRPLLILSFRMERALLADGAGPSHAVNVTLHLAVCLLLFGWMRRVGANLLSAGGGALLFALHPVHVEAVAGLVGRAELLAALFTLLALWLWAGSGRLCVDGNGGSDATPGNRAAVWGAAACLLLALLSKEIALAAPALILSLERWIRRGNGAVVRLAALAPCGLAIVVYLVLRVHALETLIPLQNVRPSENVLVALDGIERLATALGLVARNLALLVYPIGLSADYSGPVIDVEPTLLAVRPLLGLLLLLGLLALALRPLSSAAAAGSRRGPLARLSLAALCFLLPYAVIGNLFFDVGATMAERFLYLPSLGFCALIGLMFGEGIAKGGGRGDARRGAVALAILGVLVAAYGMRTWSRCLDWRDDESLFRSAVVEQPNSPRARFILGKILADRNETAPALEHFDEAARLDPEFAAPQFEKGVLLGRQGRLPEAEAAFREALRRMPSLAPAHYGLALTLRPRGRIDEARRALRKAVAWNPGLVKAWAERGNLELAARRYEAAEAAYSRALALGMQEVRPRIEEARRARLQRGGTQALE